MSLWCTDCLDRSDKKFLAALRIALGWLFFYAGITKVMNPAWSAKGYLLGAKTFAGFYAWLASDGVLPVVDFLNKWGLTLVGLALILGLFVRLASLFGALMMTMYYFPALQFPKIGANSYLVDEHIVYALVLLFFAAVKAGRWYGLEERCAKLPICAKYPRLRAWLG
ncbi:MAG TPA: DoxX family protein [Candidatus Baltobacteraceae bacterium]|nr:DoxX family protein [Candidatus Baltobacteraceae bacterium]